MKKPLTAAALLLLPLALLAQPAPILAVDDPEGDDAGDGTLIYPANAAYEKGDLDLRSLRAFAEPGGVRFEATFRNPVRSPAGVRAPGPSTEDLAAYARRGFYEFNLDLYLDTDRVSGSGSTVTLPGRGATLDAASAWEKAVVLTPRPELMRRQLIDALAAAAGSSAEAEKQVDAAVFFATDVRVRGRSVSFTVPAAFVDAATVARSSIVAFTTAARLSIESDANLFGRFTGPQRLPLGVALPEPGRPQFGTGYTGERPPATSVVDLLDPDATRQARQLAAGGAIAGLNAQNRWGSAPAAPAPAGAAPSSDPLLAAFGRSLAALLRGETAAAAPAPMAPAAPAAVAAPAPMPAPPVAPAPAAAPKAVATTPAAPAPAASAPVAPRDAAFYEQQEQRLRTLKRLRDGGLITEQEYQQKRREVLEQL
ncbi:MAG: glucodextranase DOMON-like domain-containing protein [Rubrivivax sp.]